MAMDYNYLLINLGSSSKKYALYTHMKEIFNAHFEKHAQGFSVTLSSGTYQITNTIIEHEYVHSAQYFLHQLEYQHMLENYEESLALGIRIVAPGTYFTKTRPIDESYKKQLRIAQYIAPLHGEAIMWEIDQFKSLIPHAPFIGISDSAFHTSLPEVAREYALPLSLTKELDLYRFGYHGISGQSMLRKLKNLLQSVPRHIIWCHLGSGTSVTALLDGKSIDTSMGFTPVAGIPMATRVGSIDAGAVLYIAQEKGMSLYDLNHFFNEECGLAGLSGTTGDVKRLLELESEGDARAKLALDTFVYQIKQYIGSYYVTLSQAELLVFTGTISERSPIIRERICESLSSLGIQIDYKINNELIDQEGFINSPNSKMKIVTILVDELDEMAHEMERIFPVI